MRKFKWKRRSEAVKKAASIAMSDGLSDDEAARSFLLTASSWYCDYPDEMNPRQFKRFVADIKKCLIENEEGRK